MQNWEMLGIGLNLLESIQKWQEIGSLLRNDEVWEVGAAFLISDLEFEIFIKH